MAGPMAGVKVIEMSTWAALPGGGAILADWGADVVKVEEPKMGGDPIRNFNMVNVAEQDGQISATWEQDNRGKKAITLDLGTKEGADVLRKLLSTADIFLTSTRPKTLERFDLSWEQLHAAYPPLIMVHLSGFGPKGDDGDRPGYDALCFWARAGFALGLAEPDAPPIGQRPAQGDHVASITIAGGVAAALYAREKTGKGTHVQTSLFHAGVWVGSPDIIRSAASQTLPFKFSRKMVTNPLVNSYKCRDGKWIQLLNLQADRFWAPLCRAMGREDLIDNPKYATMQERAKNGAELITIFDQEMAKRDLSQWFAPLDKHEIRYGIVQDALDASNDPQAWANDYYTRVEHPDVGPLQIVTSPFQFSEYETMPLGPSPMLGQNTEEVLIEAGYDFDYINTLRDKGIVL